VLDAVLKDICGALLMSDVNIMLVGKLRNNVKKAVNVPELGGGANKKRIIEKVMNA
jgi:signal recognition particle subunit SRP54